MIFRYIILIALFFLKALPVGAATENFKSPSPILKYKEKKLLKELEKESISLYFVNPIGAKKAKNKCINNVCLSLVALIDNAKTSIDMAVYGFYGQDEIINALRRAKKRGVVIRGVVDDYGTSIYKDTDKMIKEFGLKTDTYIPLAENTYIVKKERSQSALMHNKFFIFDNQYLWTGSTNITDYCMTLNSNNAILIHSPEIANIYSKEFSQMYKDEKFHTEKSKTTTNQVIFNDKKAIISLYFSPQDNALERGVLPIITREKQKIDITIFYLTNKLLIDELINLSKKGTKIRIIVDNTLTLEPQSGIQRLREAGISVKVENWKGKMHQKSIVTSDYLIIGSTNFTRAANLVNDENMLIIKNKRLVKKQQYEFERLWKSIPDKYLIELPYIYKKSE